MHDKQELGRSNFLHKAGGLISLRCGELVLEKGSGIEAKGTGGGSGGSININITNPQGQVRGDGVIDAGVIARRNDYYYGGGGRVSITGYGSISNTTVNRVRMDGHTKAKSAPGTFYYRAHGQQQGNLRVYSTFKSTLETPITGLSGPLESLHMHGATTAVRGSSTQHLGRVYLAGDATLATYTNASVAQLDVDANATLVMRGGHVQVSGNATVHEGGVITHGLTDQVSHAVHLTVGGALLVKQGGKIHANHRSKSKGNFGTRSIDYGSYGGQAYGTIYSNTPFGSLEDPMDLGICGGTSSPYTYAGGLVSIECAALHMEDQSHIESLGDTSSSGGSVNVRVTNGGPVEGSGVIDVGTDLSGTRTGYASGGRASITGYGAMSQAILDNARMSGQTVSPGNIASAAGTFYFRPSGKEGGGLIIRSPDVPEHVTPISNHSDLSSACLASVLIDGARVEASHMHVSGDVTLRSGGVLTHALTKIAQDALHLVIGGTLRLEDTATIDVNERSNQVSVEFPPSGSSQSVYYASHGGTAHTARGTSAIYGSFVDPVDLGRVPSYTLCGGAKAGGLVSIECGGLAMSAQSAIMAKGKGCSSGGSINIKLLRNGLVDGNGTIDVGVEASKANDRYAGGGRASVTGYGYLSPAILANVRMDGQYSTKGAASGPGTFFHRPSANKYGHVLSRSTTGGVSSGSGSSTPMPLPPTVLSTLGAAGPIDVCDVIADAASVLVAKPVRVCKNCSALTTGGFAKPAWWMLGDGFCFRTEREEDRETIGAWYAGDLRAAKPRCNVSDCGGVLRACVLCSCPNVGEINI